MRGQLQWWRFGVIPKSLLDFTDKNLCRLATYTHRFILGYSGDKRMSFPASSLAQDILTKGLEIPELVDEIYLQLCKQLTHNPRLESQVRGWHLMCMCTGTFPPSRGFELYLVNFLLGHMDDAGAIGEYALCSLRRLEGVIVSGPRLAPSVADIEAYSVLPPSALIAALLPGAKGAIAAAATSPTGAVSSTASSSPVARSDLGRLAHEAPGEVATGNPMAMAIAAAIRS
jgi:hypothetical protein